MKTAKRVLAVIVAAIMIVGTCAVAASAVGTLQARINAAAPGDTVTLTGYTTESVTINKDLTLDLNGYRLTGDYGSAAIKVTAGDVTVTNGQVDAMFRICTTQEMLETVFDTCPAAIYVSGGSLVVDGVRIVGGQVRVPGTAVSDGIVVPAGSGIMSTGGAPVTIKRCSIYGDYGVNNKIRTMPEGGVVTVEDAIILAYNTAIKGEYDIANGSQPINAADRIVGVLNSGITLEEGEQELVGNLLNDRTMIVVKSPEAIAEILNDKANAPLTIEDEGYVDYYTPTITVTPGKPKADVVAPVLDYTWPNTASTDCSYKLVPEGVLMSEGDIVALDKVDATRINSDCQVIYRVEYKIGDEARDYMDYVVSDDPEVNKLDGCLGWAGIELDQRYAEVIAKNNNNKIDSYDEVVAEVADLMWTIDNLGSEEIPGTDKQVSDLAEFKQVRKLLYRLAGVTAYEASEDRKNADGYEPFGPVTYFNLFGEQMDESKPVGTLDRIQALKDGLEATIRGSFKNTNTYGDLALWFVDEAYPELIEGKEGQEPILDELITNLTALKALLKPENAAADDPWANAVSALELGDVVDLIDLAIDYGTQAQSLITDALKNNDVKSTVDYIKANRTEIKGYVDKAVEVIQNWRTYVTPSKFLVENNTFVKTFTVRGPQELIEEEPSGDLHIDITGSGAVSFSNGTEYDGTTPVDTYSYDVGFTGGFKLEAIPEDNSVEFLYWANREAGANYILSTEPTFTMSTNSSKVIEAVFSSKEETNAIFTNPTGDICAFKTNSFDNNGNLPLANISKPFISGYGFEGWPGSDEQKTLVLAANFADGNAALTSYKTGNSAFAAANVAYGPDGAILLVNPASNSYIITPKFSSTGTYIVTFYDAGEVYSIEGTYSDVITMESNYEGSAYWVDYTTRQTVAVTKNISYLILGNASFESIQGECASRAATTTTITTTDEKVSFRVQRSVKAPFLTTGVLFIRDPESTDEDYLKAALVLNSDNENVGKGTAKFTTLDGVYAGTFNKSWLNGHKLYVRPYIEFAEGEPYYGDIVSYPVN